MNRSVLFASLLALSLAGPAAFAQDAPAKDASSQDAAGAQDQDQAPAHKHHGHHHSQEAQRDAEHSKATDDTADRLNACETKPEDQRQSCLDEAAKGG